MLDLVPPLPLPSGSTAGCESPQLSGLRVIKFGGSSLATPDHVRRAGRIALDAADAGPIIVVVSAFQGVTDALLECARLADRGDDTAGGIAYETIATRHRAAARALAGPADRLM